jgi:hypothetical protein
MKIGIVTSDRRPLAALLAVIFSAALSQSSALGQTPTLSYSGNDISAAAGTMTITCTDTVQGALWAVDLKRLTTNYMLQITRFRDLKDGGTFNYADGGDWTYGLWTAHLKTGTNGSGATLTYQVTGFEELHKAADYYSFRMTTAMQDANHVEKWRQVVTYMIYPATATGTHWTAEVVTTNTSGADQASSWLARAVQMTLSLNVSPYGLNELATLSAYDADGVSLHKQAGGTDALWKITDNLAGTNPKRQSGEIAWGQGEVLPSAAATALGLTVGRTFKLTTDLANNSTVSDQFGVALRATGTYQYLRYFTNPYTWGLPSTLPAGASYTRHSTLDVNIAGGPVNVVPVADAGPDQQVIDADLDGVAQVTLDGSLSADSDGSITSYLWSEGGLPIAAGVGPEVTLPLGVHTITLTVTDNSGAAASDTVIVMVSGDNFPPLANAGPDQTIIDLENDGSHAVMLNGSGSTDSDGTITSYVWRVGAAQVATGVTPQVTLAVGRHTIVLTVTDDDGATSTDTVIVDVTPDLSGDYYVDQTHPAASDANPGTASLPWKTIGKAASTVTAGDLVLIRGGTYREGVKVMHSGTAERRITFKAMPGERVLVSGADPITGWQPCMSSEVRNNPNWQHIYWAELTWTALAIFADEVPQQKARIPDERKGMLVIQGGDESHIIDAVNLTQPAGYWDGATVTFYTTRGGGTRQSRTVTAYDPATHQLTVSTPFTLTPIVGEDLYYVENVVSIINGPGDYAIDTTVTPNRIYLWPTGSGSPAARLVEGVRRVYDTPLVTWAAGVGYITFDGLEAAYGVMSGFGTKDDGGHHIEIINCIAHHNCYQGVGAGFGFIDRVNDLLVKHCVSYANRNHGFIVGHQNGYSGTRTHHVRIEENQIFSNAVDGIQVGWFCEDIEIIRNAIWDQWSETHPDGFQTYRSIDRILVDSNLIFNTGQFSQIENTWHATLVNNMWVGAHLNGLAPSPRTADVTVPSTGEILTLGGCDAFSVSHDTFAFMGQASMSFCSNLTFNGCVLAPGRDGCGMITGWAPWQSDYNLYWDNTGSGSAFWWYNDRGRRFADYKTVSGQDTHSAYAAPKFRNAPVLMRIGDEAKCPWYRPDLNQNTTSKLYLYRMVAGEFVAGDHVEVNWDGTVRTVSEVGADYIVIDPPLAERPQSSDFCVANWKTQTNYQLDLRLAADSPGHGLVAGVDAGSSVSIEAYMAGDFNGDGIRDVPELPLGGGEAGAQVTGWAILVDQGGQSQSGEAANGQVESRAAGIQVLRVTVDSPLNPTTISPSAVTIVAAAGGDRSNLVSNVTLSGDAREIIIRLSQKLPDADRYTVTLSSSIRDTSGRSLSGTLSLEVAALAGDVNGSGEVSVADLLAVRNLVGQPVVGAAVWCDADASGQITGSDMLLVRAALGHRLP